MLLILNIATPLLRRNRRRCRSCKWTRSLHHSRSAWRQGQLVVISEIASLLSEDPFALGGDMIVIVVVVMLTKLIFERITVRSQLLIQPKQLLSHRVHRMVPLKHLVVIIIEWRRWQHHVVHVSRHITLTTDDLSC